MERLIQKADIVQKTLTKGEVFATGASGSIITGALIIDIGHVFQALGFIIGTCYIAWQFFVSVKRYLKEHKK